MLQNELLWLDLMVVNGEVSEIRKYKQDIFSSCCFHVTCVLGRRQGSGVTGVPVSKVQLNCVRVQMDVTKRVRFAATQKVQRRRQDEDLSRYPCQNASRLHFHRFSEVSMLAPYLNQNFVFLLFQCLVPK